MLWITLSLVVLLVATAWFYSKRRHSYWDERGIPAPPAKLFLGHLPKLVSSKKGRWHFDNEVYQNYGKNGLAGIYSLLTPILYVCDPELIKQIFVKDFDHFANRRVFKSPNEDDRPLNNMLSNENGEKWKTLRSIMTPTFTSGKLRNMFDLVSNKADALVAFSLAQATKKPSVNMKLNFGRFTMDTIACCAFGLECNSLIDENAEFPKKADPFFNFGFSRIWKFIALGLTPRLFKILNLRLFPEESAFFTNVAKETIAARRKGGKRGDFLDLLLEAQAAEDTSDKSKEQIMDDITIIAQSIVFIIAGYDTTSTTLAFASHLLSKNPETQQRVRQEIQDMITENGKITYQGIMEAKYLDACLMETLRIYPVSPFLERICSKDYQIPGINLTVKKGQTIQVPSWALHHDEKYWPDPEAFIPDRFMPENKGDITPYTHMPFGLGPRNCIAMRFALMEAKVALAKLILAVDMTPAPDCEELVLSTGAGFLKADIVNLILKPLGEE